MISKPKENGDESRRFEQSVSIATDIVTVLLSATLMALPIEDGRFWPLGFIAFVPLLLRMWTRSYLSIFLLAFPTFYLYFFISLDWIATYGWFSHAGLVIMNSVSYSVVFVIYFFIIRRYKSHFFATVLPVLLVLLDYEQTIGFLGFPWPVLCHSQCLNLPLIQISSVTGCWGVTFLLVHVNEAFSHLIAGKFRTAINPIAILPVVLIGVSGLYGALSLARDLPAAEIEATVVQWDEATNESWGAEFMERAIDAYSQLTIEELTPDPAIAGMTEATEVKRIVIWPETSIPNAIASRYNMNRIQMLADRFDAIFLVGCMTWDPAEGEPLDMENTWVPRERYREYNSIVAFEPDHSVIPVYSKINLVPLGEVIPLKNYITKWFPEYPWGGEDVSPGTGYHVVETSIGTIGAVICYESVFPQPARRLVANGAEILVLGSNTSWFGRTRASYQHARFDVYRAVENGVWFCRAATTGISSIIDPQGRVLVETELFVADAVTRHVGLRSGTTLYTRWGDWVPALCGIYFILLLLGLFLVRENQPE